MGRSKYSNAECPKCGAKNSDLRHRLYSKWHECKKCYHKFAANCSPHKHGGYI